MTTIRLTSDFDYDFGMPVIDTTSAHGVPPPRFINYRIAVDTGAEETGFDGMAVVETASSSPSSELPYRATNEVDDVALWDLRFEWYVRAPFGSSNL